MQGVAPQTRICAYDRLGLGGSDPPLVSRPRTSLDIATELDTFLANAGLAGPYILVGHSAGGFNVLVYANQHPQDVVGMVLVDPCNLDIFQQMLDYLPSEYPGESSEVADCRHILKDAIEFLNLPRNKEGWDLVMSFEQVRVIRSLADLPLIVITDLHDSMCQGELGEKEDQIWTNLHAGYAALSTNGSQVITNFGHILPIENPEVVLDVILQVLEQTRRE
jgi:pimeloyl-ACP methyl ester carboxylesterase